MKKRTLLAAALLATGAVAAQAAEMTLFENAGLNGRQLTVRGYMPDINAAGFGDRNASIVVRSGTWEICTEPQFQGFCATLQPGEYRYLDTRFNARVASAREFGQVADAGTGVREAVPLRFEPRGAIEMFGQSGYRGRGLVLDRNEPNLDAIGFNDRATSLIVREGIWELCSEGGYRGTCRVFEPGRYTDIGPGLAREISSARMLAELPATGAWTPPVVTLPAPVDVPRIVLFDNENFRGRSLVLADDLGDLRRSNFNNDTASITVESGNWEVCTESFFHGECRVLAPGQYRRLDPSIYRTISSIRLAGATDPRLPPSAAAPVELFSGTNFDGRRFSALRDTPSLDPRGFNDRASSMIIHEGQWQVCSDAGFNGRCRVYGPGRYVDLGRMSNEVSSLRRIN